MDNLYCTLGFAKWNRNQAYLQEKLVFFVEVLVFSTEFVHSWLRNSYYEILESARRHTKSKHCYILTFRVSNFHTSYHSSKKNRLYLNTLKQEKALLFEICMMIFSFSFSCYMVKCTQKNLMCSSIRNAF